MTRQNDLQLLFITVTTAKVANSRTTEPSPYTAQIAAVRTSLIDGREIGSFHTYVRIPGLSSSTESLLMQAHNIQGCYKEIPLFQDAVVALLRWAGNDVVATVMPDEARAQWKKEFRSYAVPELPWAKVELNALFARTGDPCGTAQAARAAHDTTGNTPPTEQQTVTRLRSFSGFIMRNVIMRHSLYSAARRCLKNQSSPTGVAYH